jgi:hypothetical protein
MEDAVTGGVRRPALLDADDVGSEPGEKKTRIRAREGARRFDDAEASKRGRAVGHRAEETARPRQLSTVRSGGVFQS